MQLIIFILSIIYFIGLVRSPYSFKSNTLNCGLGAYNGTVPPNELFLKIIGQFNQSRGEHSCGIAINNKIRVGIGKLSKFTDFASTIEFPKSSKDYKNYNILIHTRKATVGAHTLENAHPFGFGESDGEFSFMGAHNGSLIDWKDLIKGMEAPKECPLDIDSQALLYRIYHDKNFKVLNEYKGAAALIFCYKEKPNDLYVFKGAAGDIEERPLYYTQIKDSKSNKITGVYVSSMPEPFEFSGYTDIKEVPNNTLMVFRDGKVINKSKIVRGDELSSTFNTYSTRTTTPARSYNTNSRTGTSSPSVNITTPTTSPLQLPESNNKVLLLGQTSSSIISNTGSVNNMLKIINKPEMLLISEVYRNRVYFKNFRYYLNGHIVSGIYILDELGVSYGRFTKFENAYKAKNSMTSTKNNKNNCNIYFFIDGIIATGMDAYLELEKLSKKASTISAFSISDHTDFPICGINSKSIPSGGFYCKASAVFQGSYNYPFSMYTYVFSHGYLNEVLPKTVKDAYKEGLVEFLEKLDKTSRHYILYEEVFKKKSTESEDSIEKDITKKINDAFESSEKEDVTQAANVEVIPSEAGDYEEEDSVELGVLVTDMLEASEDLLTMYVDVINKDNLDKNPLLLKLGKVSLFIAQELNVKLQEALENNSDLLTEESDKQFRITERVAKSLENFTV